MAEPSAPVLGYAIWRAENLSRFSFYSDRHQFRQLSAISVASRNSVLAVNDKLGLEST